MDLEYYHTDSYSDARWLRRIERYKYSYSYSPESWYIENPQSFDQILTMLQETFGPTEFDCYPSLGEGMIIEFNLPIEHNIIQLILTPHEKYQFRDKFVPQGGELVCSFKFAGHTWDGIVTLFNRMKELFPKKNIKIDDPRKINIYFWHLSHSGPTYIIRTINVPTWDDIENNYVGSTQMMLNNLMHADPNTLVGNILLWLGEPGTGKTYALRALGSSWAENTKFHYIIDPDVFLSSPSYLMHVVEQSDAKHQNILILEDSGELLSIHAKQEIGQRFSRLLNLADGILGQGLNIKFFITTNEEIDSLHGAIKRPGRCAVMHTFERFDRDQAMAWLASHDYEVDPDTLPQYSELSELYNRISKNENFLEEDKRAKVGFA